MSNLDDVIVAVAGGTPTGSNTITIFNSYTAFSGVPLSVCGLHRLEFTVFNDQAATLKVFKLDRNGANPKQAYGNVAIAASASTDVSGPFDFLVDGFEHVRLDLVNGGVDQGTWLPTITLFGDRAVGR